MTTLYNEYEASHSKTSSFPLRPPYPLPLARIIRTSLSFATYYQHQLSHQPLKPVQHPPSSIYHNMQAPHISSFQVIQTKESIPPETAVVGQVEITHYKKNQIAMLSGERWTAQKPEKERATQNPIAKNRNNGAHLQQRNKLTRRLNWRSRM